MKNKLKQIIYDMRTQPVIAWVTVIGTALSIFLIMTVVMMQQVNVMSFAPESHRDRMLYGMFFNREMIEGENSSSASLSYDMAKRLYAELKGVEKTAYQTLGVENVDAKGTTGEKFTVGTRQTDDNFWEVYDHKLLEGRYYTADEMMSERKVCVVSESTARRLFGGESAVGQYFELDHKDYEVVGVVANSSIFASMAYAQVFVPLDTDASWGEGGFGPFMASLLVEKGVDFEDVRNQVKARYAEVDAEIKPEGFRTVYHGAPFDQEIIASGHRGSNTTPDTSSDRYMRYAIYAILLIVPAINLSSMLHSRLRRRVSEIGVRRAFGCTKMQIVADIIAENLIVTIIGGIIGFVLGIIFAQFYDGLYTDPTGTAARPALSILLNWTILGIAFGTCFFLNIISAAVPAWQASRLNPVEAINAK